MNKKSNKEIILSISLIVKNEEKNLARCLDSLRSLMKHIPCQLIITDTGSTDNTVEIAKKYTDEVYFFEWCNDFAAARNYGLKKAVGEWFMFMDADEYFEDTVDMEQFFLTGEYKKYKSASHIVRNYRSLKNQKSYYDSLAGRLFENKEIEFCNRIHEYIPAKFPERLLESYSHHYSYAIDNEDEFLERKSRRNLFILEEEYRQNPENIRIAYHLSLEYSKDENPEKFYELLEKWYKKTKNDKNNPFRPFFFKHNAIMCYVKGDTKGAVQIINEYMETKTSERLWDVDFFLLWAKICYHEKSFSESIELCEKGIRLLKKKAEGELHNDNVDFIIMPASANKEGECELNEIEAYSYMETGKIQNAIAVFERMDITNVPNSNFYRVLSSYFALLLKTERIEKIINVCKQVYNEGDAIRTNEMFNALECELLGKPKLIKQVSELMKKEDVFAKNSTLGFLCLYRFRSLLSTNQKEAEKEINNAYAQLGSKKLESSKAEFLLGLLLGMEKASLLLYAIDIEELQEYTTVISQNCDCLAELLINGVSISEIQSKNIKEIFFILCLLEATLLKEDREERCNLDLLYKSYVYVGQRYIYSVYSDKLLNEENISVLPRPVRFIYYAGIANSALEVSRQVQAVRYLKAGIKHYPVMHKVVDGMLNNLVKQIEEESLAEKARLAEFNKQAQLIKAKILEIRDMGMRDQAIELLSSYKQINPSDVEGIRELERALGIDN